jgi:DNA-binding transcriptional ArsR family regulator
MQAATRKTPVGIEAAMTAIANPRRRQILRLVWDSERSAGEIAATINDVSWPAVSQNLRLLKDCGLITQRRLGTHRYYRADRRALGPLEAVLRQMWTRDLGRLRDLAELEAGSRKKRHD